MKEAASMLMIKFDTVSLLLFKAYENVEERRIDLLKDKFDKAMFTAKQQ